MSDTPRWEGRNLGPAVPGKRPTWTKFVGLAEVSIEQRESKFCKYWVIQIHGMQTIGLTDAKGLLKRFPVTDPVMPARVIFETANWFAYGQLNGSALDMLKGEVPQDVKEAA